MKIALIKEKSALDSVGERRVVLTPEGAKKLTAKEFEIHCFKGIGNAAGFLDQDYEDAGVHFHDNDESLFDKVDISLTLHPLSDQEIAYLPPHSALVGVLKPHLSPLQIKSLASERVSSFSLELVPRITRAQSMDILSSQSSLAGYRAVIEGASTLNRAFPMMMTPAGTIAPARVLILGAGVAGLQAIATAKRLGAIVSAFDVRAAAKEQVESLGATFISVEVEEKGEGEGGYAKEMSDAYQQAQKAKLTDVLRTQDLVITTAQIPMKKAPILIDETMMNTMKNGSLIIDLASETGGNCALTEHGKIITHQGVTIKSAHNILNHIAFDASQLFSRNVVHFLTNMIKDGKINFDDEIVKATCLTHEGAITHPLFQPQDSDAKGE